MKNFRTHYNIHHPDEVKDMAKELMVKENDIYYLLHSNNIKKSYCWKNSAGRIIAITDDTYVSAKYPGCSVTEVVTVEELERFRKEYSLDETQSNNVNADKLKEIPLYLDPEHPHYSTELARAVKLWLAIVSENPIDGEQFKTKLTHHMKPFSDLGSREKARLRAIVNRYKPDGE